MKDRIEITVDGKPLTVERNVALLQALREQGAAIPSLCFYPSLGGYGSCGLCVVEIYTGDTWVPRHSCILYPEEGMQVRTASPLIRHLRSWAARLLLHRGPFPRKEVEEMLIALVREGAADEESIRKPGSSGVTTEGQDSPLGAGCILCGLCVRICEKIGKSRLTFLGRGKNLRVGLVPGGSEEVGCGRCRACRRICPTGFIAPDARHAFTASLYR